MLEVLAWMVVPAAAAESPLRVEPRESETSASAVFVRVSSVLMLSSGNIMASCYAHLSLSQRESLYCDVFERVMPHGTMDGIIINIFNGTDGPTEHAAR